jgi:hypothetical protein
MAFASLARQALRTSNRIARAYRILTGAVKLTGVKWRPRRKPPPTPLSAVLGTVRDARDASEIPGFRFAVLKVRIHLPPAASPLRTDFSRGGSRTAEEDQLARQV